MRLRPHPLLVCKVITQTHVSPLVPLTFAQSCQITVEITLLMRSICFSLQGGQRGHVLMSESKLDGILGKCHVSENCDSSTVTSTDPECLVSFGL